MLPAAPVTQMRKARGDSVLGGGSELVGDDIIDCFFSFHFLLYFNFLQLIGDFFSFLALQTELDIELRKTHEKQQEMLFHLSQKPLVVEAGRCCQMLRRFEAVV